MKKIFLVDRQAESRVVESVLTTTDWYIQVLIVLDDATKARYLNHKRIGIIYTATEFFLLDETAYIDFSKYKEYESIFKIVDSGMYRIEADYQFVRYNFYMGITVWEKLFDNYKPDLCILAGMIHGLTFDSLMLAVAKRKSILGYVISAINMHLLVTYKGWGECILQLEYKYRKKDVWNIVQKDAYYYKELKIPEQKNHSIKAGIIKLISTLGGVSTLLVVRSLFHGKSHFTWYEGRKLKTSIFNYAAKTLQWKYITILNDKKSVKADYDCKYVVYFLHFEPEAVISHYANHMDSQIIIIKMIAKSLPKGWKLYVKEHPDTRKLNDNRTAYALAYFMEFYKPYNSMWYWESIRNTPNLEFINVKEDATKLIKNAKAISTMAGTVIMESILNNKPCLIFGDSQKIPYSSISGIYNISSTDECRHALDEIENSKWQGYKNLEIVNTCLLIRDKNGYESAVQNIIEDVDK